MKRKRACMSGILATSACLVLAMSGVASAQTLVHTDPAHDVVKTTYDGVVAAPTNKTADVVHVRFAHTSLRVTTTMRVRHYGGSWEYYGAIRTPTREYVVFGTGSGTSKDFYLTKPESETPIPCRGFSARVRPAENSFRVSIPRTCLQRPRWVRMGLVYIVFGTSGDFFDNSLRKGSGYDGLTLTARLYRN